MPVLPTNIIAATISSTGCWMWLCKGQRHHAYATGISCACAECADCVCALHCNSSHAVQEGKDEFEKATKSDTDKK